MSRRPGRQCCFPDREPRGCVRLWAEYQRIRAGPCLYSHRLARLNSPVEVKRKGWGKERGERIVETVSTGQCPDWLGAVSRPCPDDVSREPFVSVQVTLQCLLPVRMFFRSSVHDQIARFCACTLGTEDGAFEQRHPPQPS